jgi:hypothetical protein
MDSTENRCRIHASMSKSGGSQSPKNKTTRFQRWNDRQWMLSLAAQKCSVAIVIVKVLSNGAYHQLIAFVLPADSHKTAQQCRAWQFTSQHVSQLAILRACARRPDARLCRVAHCPG